MMKAGDAFKATYLKAEDIKGHKPTVTISDVQLEEIGQGKDRNEKPVLYFKGKDKGMVINRTNWARIEEFLGSDESDDWIGLQIVLGVERVDFKGDRVDALRVIGAPKGQKKLKREAPEESFNEADDDTVPF